MRAIILITLAIVVAASAGDAQGQRRDYLWQCIAIGREDARHSCYGRLLLERVEASRDPARELPEIDRDVRAMGGEILGACHALMHDVGRRYARAHRLTLATLRDHIPRSSDPTCSAGFGMGLVMYLGPELVRTGGRGALDGCLRLPTRFRGYICVHGLGHALMRGFHGQLRPAVAACRALGPHGVDCAQGAFHDYWISLRAADGTTRPRNAITSPRTICDGRFTYVRPCWYRYFIEQRFGPRLENASDIRRTCAGLSRLQRSGCVAGATLALSSDPFAQALVCERLSRADRVACFHGVAVQALAGDRTAQTRLLRRCQQLGRAAGACYAWFGRTLTLVGDGRFGRHGCGDVRGRAGRAACRAGAARIAEPLVTFS